MLPDISNQHVSEKTNYIVDEHETFDEESEVSTKIFDSYCSKGSIHGIKSMIDCSPVECTEHWMALGAFVHKICST